MFRIIALILLALCSLSSCSSGESRNDVISVAVSQEPPTFDVHVNSSQVARYVIAGTVAERVVTLDSQGRPVPELAQSFHSEDEGCTWVFTLRDDVLTIGFAPSAYYKQEILKRQNPKITGWKVRYYCDRTPSGSVIDQDVTKDFKFTKVSNELKWTLTVPLF